jgi:hypothetical protein
MIALAVIGAYILLRGICELLRDWKYYLKEHSLFEESDNPIMLRMLGGQTGISRMWLLHPFPLFVSGFGVTPVVGYLRCAPFAPF